MKKREKKTICTLSGVLQSMKAMMGSVQFCLTPEAEFVVTAKK
jgi:hypothetical protein